jgi:RND family efflux transporter MFP subunit
MLRLPHFPLQRAWLVVLGVAIASASVSTQASEVVLAPTTVTEWKAVYGRIEPRDTVAARARIGGTLVELLVSEGETVAAGQRIATIHDDKIALQVTALDAERKALDAQLANAESELARGQALVEGGVVTEQRLGQLTTQVDVYRNQIAASEAQRQVLLEQEAEGDVLAPNAGLVLAVPVTRGAVLMPGEAVASIGSGGFFLRLAVPERHADLLEGGAVLGIEAGSEALSGRLSKIYPQIENGRVIADVEVDGLPTDFVDRRVLVRLPVGSREALMVPTDAVVSRSGLDFVTLAGGEGEVERSVVLGITDGDLVEVVSGLVSGDTVVAP